MEPHWTCESTRAVSNEDAAKFIKKFLEQRLNANSSSQTLQESVKDINSIYRSVKFAAKEDKQKQSEEQRSRMTHQDSSAPHP